MAEVQDSEPVFVRVVVLGRIRAWHFAHAIRRHLEDIGVDPEVVFHRRGSGRSGWLDETRIEARLPVQTWMSIADWSARKFPSLHVEHVISGQLAIYSKHGVTGEEPYERGVA